MTIFQEPTNQEVFEAGLVHLFKQGNQCRVSGCCSYGKKDAKAGCFIGGLLPVALRYNSSGNAIEGAIDNLDTNGLAKQDEIRDAWAPFIGRDITFLKDCQKLHDYADDIGKSEWGEISVTLRRRTFHSRAVDVANKHGLRLPTFGELLERARDVATGY